MHHRLGSFRAALLTGWIGLSTAGFLYARQKDIPLWTAIPIIAAFLLEYSFYLAAGFETIRGELRTRLAGWRLALAMAASAVAPYLAYSIPTGQFHWTALAELAALALVVCFWYVAIRPSPFADVLFLVLLAALVLTHVFQAIYASPIRIHIDILGRLMLIRTGAMVMIELRRVEGIGFGFIPTQHEWIAGIRYFFYFLPVGFPLALWLGLVQLNFTIVPFWKTLANFVGALWVLALSEEFFFRGLVQNWLTEWSGKPRLALAAASVIFGAVHLPFGVFPNWKLALVAAVSGLFYGRAYQKAGGIRAAMVTHALVVTIRRTMFV